MAHVAVEDEERGPGTCWCCGVVGDAERMVHLGNHPEVLICPGCARWAAKEAAEIEDRDRTGYLPRARDTLRDLRRRVIQRGWHRNKHLGPSLRWIGKWLP